MEHFFLKQENFAAILFDPQSLKIEASNQHAERLLNKTSSQLKGDFIDSHFSIDEQIWELVRSRGSQKDVLLESVVHLEKITVFAAILTLQPTRALLVFQRFEDEQNTQELMFLPLLRNVIGEIDFSSFVLDENGQIMGCNHLFANSLDYEPSEIIEKNFFDLLFDDEEGKKLFRQYKKLLNAGEFPATLQIALKKKNGQQLQTFWNNSLVRDAHGQVLGLHAVGLDLHYLMRLPLMRGKSGELEEVIARISSLFAASPSYKIDDCINQTLKIVGEYAQVDRSYVFLFRENLQIMDNTHEWCSEGIEPQIENLQGLPSQIVPWWMKKLLRHEIIHIPKVDALPLEASVEKEILQAQDIKSLIVVPMSEGENLIGFMGFDSVRRSKFWPAKDINLLKIVSSIFVSSLKRKSAELSLADSERRYRTLFKTAPDLIFVLDLKGKISALNPAFKSITGYEPENWIGRSFKELLPEEERSHFEGKIKKCLEESSTLNFEVQIDGKNGQRIIEIISVPLIERGKVAGIYGIGRDITERKALEENLRHAERMKSLGILAGGIAHDFNNILGILMGNYTLLNEMLEENEEAQFALGLIRQAIDRGKNLVQNLLTFARKKKPNIVPLDLNEEIEQVVSLLRQTTPRTIQFDLNLNADSPVVRSDRVQLHQVILNLCLNAIDAIKAKKNQGNVTIKTEMKTINQKPFIHLLIEDDGIGMDQETQKFLYDPFFTTKEGGTGLGLAVVFGVIKELGGQIKVESQPGQGSTFHIFLPHSSEQPMRTSSVYSRKKSDLKPQKSFTLFLVEDDALLSKMLRYILERYGYRVLSAFAGNEAVEIFQESMKSIDLVILDYDLPEKDGLHIAHWMKTIQPNVKIILTSGYLTPEIRKEIEKLDFVTLFEKPYEPEEILATIPKILTEE